MMRAPTTEDQSTSAFAAALWIWTGVVSIGTGVAFGNAFATYDSLTDITSFNGGAFIGGLVVGAFSTIPFWALFSFGKHILRNLIKLRADLAAGA